MQKVIWGLACISAIALSLAGSSFLLPKERRKPFLLEGGGILIFLAAIFFST